MSVIKTFSFPSVNQWLLNFRIRFGQWVLGDINSVTNDNTVGAKSGRVFLVGAGPGDPGLLTIHALRAIQSADVVLIDYLVSDEIVALIPHRAEQRYVGKRAGHHSMSQAAICELIADYALQGKTVVRLKGGDPSIFGRTAEEANVLEQNGIDYAVVPGITSASAASAYTGIPLTLRDHAQSVRLMTAHMRDPEKMPDWSQLVRSLKGETQVFYMGLNRLSEIVSHLCAAGMPTNMPIAVVDKASTLDQQTCIGTAHTIVDQVQSMKFSGPSLIVVGEAVSHRYSLSPELLVKLSVCGA